MRTYVSKFVLEWNPSGNTPSIGAGTVTASLVSTGLAPWFCSLTTRSLREVVSSWVIWMRAVDSSFFVLPKTRSWIS